MKALNAFMAFIKPFEGTAEKSENKNLSYFLLFVWDWDGKG